MSEFEQASHEAVRPGVCPFLKSAGVNFLGLHFHPQGTYPVFNKVVPSKMAWKCAAIRSEESGWRREAADLVLLASRYDWITPLGRDLFSGAPSTAQYVSRSPGTLMSGLDPDSVSCGLDTHHCSHSLDRCSWLSLCGRCGRAGNLCGGNATQHLFSYPYMEHLREGLHDFIHAVPVDQFEVYLLHYILLVK